MALAVLALVLGASLPAFRSMMEGNRHRNGVSLLTSRLFLARQLAVRSKLPCIVRLDLANSRFSVFQDANGDGVLGAGETLLGPYAMEPGVSIQNVDWIGNQLTFFPNGSASRTSEVRIVDGKGRAATIRVNSITGSVEILP